MNKKTKKAFVMAAGLVWVVLQLYTGVKGFLYGLYQTYTVPFWILLGVWLAGLLVLDVRLVSGGAGRLCFVKWYWAFSAALAAGVILAADMDLIRDVNGFLVFAVLCTFLTPLNQLLAFTWLLELAGLEGIVRYGAGCGAVLFFCLLHFLYFTWLHRRAKRRGEHGPVDPGTGTMESGL